ncbi:MAG: transglycosylase domain-containing protein [Candidatus Phosphoribacter baldrii]
MSHDPTRPRARAALTRAQVRGATAKRPWWRAPRRTWIKRILWTFVGAGALGMGAVVFAFATIQVPDVANGLADAQTSIVYYDDGKTEMARIAELDRESIPLASIPTHLQQAVIAAEDRDFYTNSGVSPGGIARSVWQAVRGADVQGGGSTITQQYVKNYFLTQDRTLDRKLREMVISIKIDRDLTKDQILEGYLNTIYFGRGAYGVKTAAKAYFGKDVSQLTVAESAVLASVMNAPSLYDPALGAKQQTNLTNRFGYVLDGMVSMGWLSATDRAPLTTLPAISAKAPSRALSGPTGYIVAAVRQELVTKLKLSDDDIDRGGLRITTTISAKAQKAAQDSVAKNFPKTGAVKDVYAGLVSIRPGDGAVVALYGGADYQARQFSAATDAVIQGGSNFKPFTLIAALQQGISTKTLIDGGSPLKDPALGNFTVRNAGGRSYGQIDLRKATASSVNTAFVRLNLKIGPASTKAAAIAAGIPESTLGLGIDPTNTLGTASPHIIDMANGYATIAAQGRRATPYLIKQVTSNAIDVTYTAVPNVVDAFSKEVAADVIDAMAQVTAAGGTGARASQVGRPVAGKTGTSEDSKSVWFSGFTPQLQASVAMFKDVNGVPQPLSDIGGIDELSGGSFPLTIWIDYMKGALTGEEKLEFPKRAGIGDDKVKTAAPTSTATATSDPTGTSTTTPTPDPIPTVPGPTTRPTVTVPGPKPTHTVGPTNSKPTAPPGQG